MSIIKCPDCGKLVAIRMPIHDCSKTLAQVFASEKHGVELRFVKGRKLKLFSYAVWNHGTMTVSHETTAFNRRAGIDLKALVDIELSRDPSLKII